MRAPFVMLLLVATFLAGCTEDPAPVEPDDGPSVVTDPRDLAAGNTMGEHVHDYWGGQDRIVVLEQSINYGCGGCQSILTFRPDPLDVVPLGTAQVEVTASWTEQLPAHHDPMRLLVKTAADNEAEDLGSIENGETVVLPVTLDQADLPHQVLSAWEFQITLSGTPLATFFGTFELAATAVRGLEIPPFPAHPDHWQGRQEIALFEMSQTVAQIDFDGGATIGTSFDDARPDDGVLVPQGTGVVRVVLQQGAAETPLGLRYHGADTWEWTEATPVSDDGTTRSYEIVVGDLQPDGPYAKQSLWEFIAFADTDTPATAYAGTYSLSATAIKA